MPVINTRGALSATGFGFLGIAGRYWYLTLDTTGSLPQINGIVIGSDNSTYFSAYAGGQSGMTQVKLNYPGVIQWQRKLANSASLSTSSKAMCLDTSGNSYYLAVNNASYPAISKYNSSGTSQWIYAFTNNFTGVSLAVDSSGNLYFVGVDGSGGTTKGILVKFNSSGSIQWQKALAMGTTLYSYTGIAIDSSDNVYISGAYASTYLAIVKYNSSGAVQWQRNYTDFLGPIARAIAIDQNNVSYVAGEANLYACIAKVNSSGADQGFFRVESTTGGFSRIGWISVATDNLGNVYAAGYYLNAAGRVMGVVARLTDTGTLTWANTIDATTGGGGGFCYSITVDRFGDLYVGGYSLSGSSNNEIILKLPRNGEQLGTFGGMIYSSITASLSSAMAPSYTVTTTVPTETTPTFAVGSSILTSSTTTMTSALTHI